MTMTKSLTCVVALLLVGQPFVAQEPPQNVPPGAKAIRDLEYAKVGDVKLVLDLYLPSEGDGPFPVIVAIHGGGWAAGKKEQAPGIRLASRGYAVAAINYRLSGVATFPAQIEDCKAAVRWLRANAKKYNLDGERIGATGHSAGGHLASLLGTGGSAKEFDKRDNLDFSSKVQAVCAMSGPTDFLQMDAHSPKDARFKHDDPRSPESRLIGGPIQENKQKVAKANPLTHVSKESPPFLIIHGDQDPLVPVHQAQLLHDALKEKGVEVKLHLVKGVGHAVGGRDVNDQIDRFFDTHLKKATKREPRTMLIQPDELQKQLKRPGLRILDTRPQAEYAKGHLPGAMRVDVKSWQDLGKKEGGFHHAKAWGEKIGELGITADAHVVVYGSAPTDTARIWWTLKYLGLSNVMILDGGWGWWIKEKRPTDDSVPSVVAGKFEPKFQADRLEEMDSMKKAVRTGSVTVIDTRSTDEFTGKEVRGKRGGHIPAAKHLEWKELLGVEGRFKSPSQLRALFQERGIRPEQACATY